jgi:hypothetical protein
MLSLFSLNVDAQVTHNPDADADGIEDSLEIALANQFAPVIFHDINEKHLPTNVDSFLRYTRLYIYDDACTPDVKKLVVSNPSQSDLLHKTFEDDFCGSTGLVRSDCTRSDKKQRTFYLSDVPEPFKAGSKNPGDWTTYVHCYRNKGNGITIQYWRFYASDIMHGGDWECVGVVLDLNYKPIFIDLPGHTSIDRFPWLSVHTEGDHPLVFSQNGGHSSVIYNNQSGFRQETWSGGKTTLSTGETFISGSLINMGEKTHPLNNQVFIQYSGLWGSPGTLYFSSGYWSPSYNETGMTSNKFITAWCNEMIDGETKEVNGVKECYPCSISR